MQSVVTGLDEIHRWTGTYDPFEIAQYLEFEVVFTNKLPKGKLALSVPELKVIFISIIYKGLPFSYFLCSHELVHGTEHDGIQAFYNGTSRAKGRLEMEADTGAIHLLCKYYLEQFPDIESLNVTSVAKHFCLFEEWYPLIEKELKLIL